MMLAAHQKMDEPYLRTELMKSQRWQRKDLGNKLNILVDKAAYVMGVIDELGVLQEGEIFMKHTRNGELQTLLGTVLITR